MSRKASQFQKKVMSWGYRGKEIFKPLNTGWIDEHVACVREWIANVFFYTKGGTTIMIDAGYSYERLAEKMAWLEIDPASIAHVLITHQESPDENTAIYTGHDVAPYMEALVALGYAPEQVSKVLLTHKHADHSGELRSFPGAEIWVNEHEAGAKELEGLANIKAISFTDGPYKNFPESQKVAEGIWYVRAESHTLGNSIVIAEDADEGLFCLFQGDVTYTDEALYANKLSEFFEDIVLARETLDRIREFVSANPTVYLSTHTPLGPENLAAKRVVDLENPPETIPVGEITFKTRTGKYVCSVCGYVYDPAEHDGVAFEDLHDDWKCPRCRQPKEKFPDAKGFSTTNLWYMKKWYQFYASDPNNASLHQLEGELGNVGAVRLEQVGERQRDEILHQAGGEMAFPAAFGFVPWRHHVEIITHCGSVEEAAFYIGRTIQEGWSRSALDNAIRADFFHSVGKAQTNFGEVLPSAQGALAQEITKDTYDLRFISLSEAYDERDLEAALERNITRFLLELGMGFAFVGRQVEILVSGKTRRVDMLFYHIRLRCYVAVELKARAFEPEFAGKLNFYVNAVDDLMRGEGDDPTIGLLICKEKDATEVQWAFRGISTPMGVATYDNVRIEDTQRHLPSEELEEMGIADELFEADGSLDGWESARGHGQERLVHRSPLPVPPLREVPPEGGRELTWPRVQLTR